MGFSATLAMDDQSEKPKKTPKNPNLFRCDNCDKTYKDKTGLWRHKKKCGVPAANLVCQNAQPVAEPSSQISPELVLQVLEKNKELTEVVIEQNKTIMELSKNSQIQTQNNTAHGVFKITGWNGTASAEFMRVDGASGNVGIGTSSPQVRFHANSGTTDEVARFESSDQFADIQLKDSGGASHVRSSNGSLILEADRANAVSSSAFLINVDNSEALRIISSGNVGIGRTSPVSKLDVYNSSGTTPAFTTFNAGNSSDITSFAAHAALQLICYQSEGNPYTKTSAIIANADGTVPSEMQFWTKTNGASSAAERMRIDSSGNLGIGTTSPGRTH